MKTRAGLVVIGGGQAGYQVAASARKAGFDDPIVIIADEGELPYQRPPLSKAYLLGKQTRNALAFQQYAFYDQNRIALSLGRRAVRVDRHARRVVLDDGAELSFDWLVIATGAQSRKLPGVAMDGVLSLRDLRDADELAGRMGPASEIAVIGGGFIGLEFAAVARSFGKKVVVIEAQDRLLARSVPKDISDYLRSYHERHGVRFRMNAMVGSIERNGDRLSAVRLEDGSIEPADLVLVGVGATPNCALALDAGLMVNDGIVVDGALRTSDSRILAIGDCARFPVGSGFRRLESVQNAVDQGKHAAQTILGSITSYAEVPWFWSDQNDLRLQMTGDYSTADEIVLRGNPEAGRFSTFAFCNNRLVGVHSVNQPADHVVSRKLLKVSCSIDPDQAADLTVDLRALAQRIS